MGMSPDLYGAADEAESIATIHAAIDAGITLLDTGDFYGMGHNELLIGRALRDRRARGRRTSASSSAPSAAPDRAWLGYDASPPAVKTALAYTLQPPRHRPRRRLPARAARPRRADRGDRRRDRRARRGRLRPPHRALRGRRRHDPPRRRRRADHRPPDRVVADLARRRGRDPRRLPRARHRHHRLRRPLPRADLRPLDARPRQRGRLRLPHLDEPALPGRGARAQPRASSRRCARSPTASAPPRAGRDRLGARARRGRRAARRRPPPRPARRGARRARRSRSTTRRSSGSTRRSRPAWPRATATRPRRWAMLDSER